jgi:hypothetical protein
MAETMNKGCLFLYNDTLYILFILYLLELGLLIESVGDFIYKFSNSQLTYGPF